MQEVERTKKKGGGVEITHTMAGYLSQLIAVLFYIVCYTSVVRMKGVENEHPKKKGQREVGEGTHMHPVRQVF